MTSMKTVHSSCYKIFADAKSLYLRSTVESTFKKNKAKKVQIVEVSKSATLYEDFIRFVFLHTRNVEMISVYARGANERYWDEDPFSETNQLVIKSCDPSKAHWRNTFYPYNTRLMDSFHYHHINDRASMIKTLAYSLCVIKAVKKDDEVAFFARQNSTGAWDYGKATIYTPAELNQRRNMYRKSNPKDMVKWEEYSTFEASKGNKVAGFPLVRTKPVFSNTALRDSIRESYRSQYY